MWQHRWALFSGFLGATASCLVKLGVDNSSPLLRLVEKHIEEKAWLADLDQTLHRMIHVLLEELMVQYQINLDPYWKSIRTNVMEEIGVQLHLFEVDYGQLLVVLPLRILCVVAMLVTNVYMIASFLKGIQDSGSVGGTSLSTAANFVSSALYGKLLWGEQMNGRWTIGFLCVLIGVVILSSETTEKEEEENSTTSSDKKQKKKDIAIDTSNIDVKKRINNLESKINNPTPRPVTPPPPQEIYTKTRSRPASKNGLDGKVEAMKASLTKKRSPPQDPPATTPIKNISITLPRKITPSPEKNRIPSNPNLYSRLLRYDGPRQH